MPYGPANEVRTFSFWHHSLWEWGVNLVQDPILAHLFSWHAIRLHKWDGRQWVRFVDEPNTGDLWWEIEVCDKLIGCSNVMNNNVIDPNP